MMETIEYANIIAKLTDSRDSIIEATIKLMSAVKVLHPQFDIAILDQENCYLAYHECRESIEKVTK